MFPNFLTFASFFKNAVVGKESEFSVRIGGFFEDFKSKKLRYVLGPKTVFPLHEDIHNIEQFFDEYSTIQYFIEIENTGVFIDSSTCGPVEGILAASLRAKSYQLPSEDLDQEIRFCHQFITNNDGIPPADLNVDMFSSFVPSTRVFDSSGQVLFQYVSLLEHEKEFLNLYWNNQNYRAIKDLKAFFKLKHPLYVCMECKRIHRQNYQSCCSLPRLMSRKEVTELVNKGECDSCIFLVK